MGQFTGSRRRPQVWQVVSAQMPAARARFQVEPARGHVRRLESDQRVCQREKSVSSTTAGQRPTHRRSTLKALRSRRLPPKRNQRLSWIPSRGNYHLSSSLMPMRQLVHAGLHRARYPPGAAPASWSWPWRRSWALSSQRVAHEARHGGIPRRSPTWCRGGPASWEWPWIAPRAAWPGRRPCCAGRGKHPEPFFLEIGDRRISLGPRLVVPIAHNDILGDAVDRRRGAVGARLPLAVAELLVVEQAVGPHQHRLLPLIDNVVVQVIDRFREQFRGVLALAPGAARVRTRKTSSMPT